MSLDGGNTWLPANTAVIGSLDADEDGDSINDDNDKEFIAVGPDVFDTTKDRFAVTFQRSGVIYASTSPDGLTWCAPVIVGGVDGHRDNGDLRAPSGHSIDAIPRFGPNGELYVVWEEWGTAGVSHVMFDVSYDGGKTWGGGLDQKVFFDTDKSNLDSGDKLVLDQTISMLKADPTLIVTVAGHTDTKASDAYNDGLSERRAASVSQYLVTHDIDPGRIVQVGFGENRLAVPTADEVDEVGNRRVEISLDRLIYTGNVNVFNDPASGGRYDIPAQPVRGVWMGLSMDVDHSGGVNNGRIYVSLTDQADRDGDDDSKNPTDHNNTDIFVLASDDDGRRWNALGDAPVRVNDDEGDASQFHAWLGVDQKSGDVAVSWYDARNDQDATPNDEVQYFAALSTDGGKHWSNNVQVSDGMSDTSKLGVGVDYGDYSGLAFVDGTIDMTWTDNSNSTGDNPDHVHSLTDVYFDHIKLADGDHSIARGSSTGIGIAVAVNVADVTADASIGKATISADGVIVQALMLTSGDDSSHHFSAKATSGASGADTGVAGSLAINIGLSHAHATLAPNATVTVTDNGDVKLIAQSFALNEASAAAHQSKAGKVGVGASIALNIGTTDTTATIGDEVTIGGAHEVLLDASSKNDMTTVATGGSAGKTAVTPVVAISVANNDSHATLGALTDDSTGDAQAMTIKGSLKASAAHAGSVHTSAEGNTKSADTGVGISIALTIASDTALATTARDLTAAGAVTFSARSTGSDDALAKASSAGGEQT
ncbi:MAG: hypothetical protein E6H54_11135, partial [Betaproteobacteria bacterium]